MTEDFCETFHKIKSKTLSKNQERIPYAVKSENIVDFRIKLCYNHSAKTKERGDTMAKEKPIDPVTEPQQKPSRHGSAITQKRHAITFAKIMIFIGITVSILSILLSIALKEPFVAKSPNAIIVPSILLLIILESHGRTQMVIKKKAKRANFKKQQKGEFHSMLELAKQLIGEECKIISIGIGPVKGIIKEVTDGAVKLETKYGDYIFNVDFIMAIEKKNKK